MASPALSPQVTEALTSFSATLEGPDFRAQLDRLFPRGGSRRAPEDLRLRMIKAHKNRATFDMALRTATGWLRAVAKIYAWDASSIAADMQATVDAGLGPASVFSVPRPLAYLPDLQVLLQEMVWGTPAHEVFVKGSPAGCAEAARRSGEWLARFHGSAPAFPRRVPLHRLMTLGQLWVDQVSYGGDSLGPKAVELYRRILGKLPSESDLRPCAGHGSFIPEHVFLSGLRTAVIDLDECDAADPGRDLAVFVVALQRIGLKHHGSLESQDRAVETFLETYGRRRRGAFTHLPFYRALECLHKAWRDVCGRLVPIRPWAETMLDEGLRLI